MMENRSYKSVTVMRPANRSLEAYKAWMRELAKKLSKHSEVKWIEEEWIANWKRFWKDKHSECMYPN